MKHALAATLCLLTLPVAAQPNAPESLAREALVDERGRINVWLLRDDVSKVEAAQVLEDIDRCSPEGDGDAPRPSRKELARMERAEKACVQRIQQATERYQAQRDAFNAKWQSALQQAIRSGDEVAEVIWRQCTTTPAIDRTALASTCDEDPKRRKEAGQRLRKIGFEAALDEEAEGTRPAWEPDQNKRRTESQARILRQMEAGVFGGWTIDAYHGGNAPYSAHELFDIRRAAVLSAASTMVRRSFTYVRLQDGSSYDSHSQLRLNRKPTGTPTLAWSANVLHSGSPYSGPYDPAWDGFQVYLNYDRGREVTVGGPRDAQYLRMLHTTLTRSEQRIDDWLRKDPRWSVFLLQRQGHHEWIPQGMTSPFGRLDPSWEGEWTLERTFENFQPVANATQALLRIRLAGQQTTAQFDEAGSAGYACELRYSGGNSYRPQGDNHASTATTSAIGYLPALASSISPHDAGPVAPFAPMDPRKTYRQVLVQCPQGEWPDNRNKRFMFLANDALIELRKAANSRDLVILHWKRKGALDPSTVFAPLSAPFDLKPVLARLDQSAKAAEKADQSLEQLRAKVGSLTADELIASLTQWRLEKRFYSSRDFPDNLARLIQTPGIATKACTAYRSRLEDALQRFNLMVVLNVRARGQQLSPEELAVVPDCLRLALSDQDATVRLEAVDAFALFAQEKDREKLTKLLNDPSEDVRRYTQNALNRINTGKRTN